MPPKTKCGVLHFLVQSARFGGDVFFAGIVVLAIVVGSKVILLQ